MPLLPNPFRLVYRSFDRIVFDRVKSDNVFTLRGFDLTCAGQVFPGYVLERPASPHPAEARFQVLGELGGSVVLLIYSRLGRTCRLLTGWVAEPREASLWFIPESGEPTVQQGFGFGGRCDPARMSKCHPDDTETRPQIPAADIAATHAELSALRLRLIRPASAP